MRNVEIKAKVRNLKNLIEKAKQLSGTNAEIIHQHDTFYKVNQGRLKLRKFENGDGELIYYERSDLEGPKLSSFDIARFNKDSVNNLNTVLSRALGTTSIVKKVRQLFLVGQTRVHVDSVENLGDFMELEVVLTDNQSVEDGEKIANELMRKLEIEEDDLITGAYADLLNK